MNWYIFGAVYFVGFLVSPFVWRLILSFLEGRKYFEVFLKDYLLSLVWPMWYIALIIVFMLSFAEGSLTYRLDKKFKNPFYKEKE